MTDLAGPGQQASMERGIAPLATAELPHNLEAEQMLLGSLLWDNENLHAVDGFLLAEHFYHPFHRRLFQAIVTLREKSLLASPVTLQEFLAHDEGLQAVGGMAYLHQLVGLAGVVVHVRDYAQTIYDLALRRSLIAIGESIILEGRDPTLETSGHERIETAEQKLFELASRGHLGQGFQSMQTVMARTLAYIETSYQNKNAVSGIATGFINLDHLLGGFHNSDLVILAARPSMGKTALAINMALGACENLYAQYQAKGSKGLPPAVAFLSLEMSSEQLAARMLSMKTEINASKLRTGHIEAKDYHKLATASREISSLPFLIDDTPALSIAAVRAKARRMKRKHGLALLVVDYLQLMRGHGNQKEANRVQEISEISQGLKAIAKELQIPVIALSQLSRAVEQREDKRPQLSDLRESGSIEQDADLVLFIYREEYYLARQQPQDIGSERYQEWQAKLEKVANKADVIIAKHRNGPIGHASLRFDAATTRFSNLDEEISPERENQLIGQRYQPV